MHAAHAVGERRRPGLQDVGRLDLEELILAHRWDRLPARPRHQTLRTEFLPAPRRQDHLGLLFDYKIWVGDDASTRRLRARQLRKDILAAGDLDELAHPADAADHRLVPLLEVDPRPPRKRFRRIPN